MSINNDNYQIKRKLEAKQENERNRIRLLEEASQKLKENEFEEILKNSPSPIDDIYIWENMSKIKSLKYVPENSLQNAVLMNHYFKAKRKFNDYKRIGDKVLSNKLFIKNALKANPEMYFILSAEDKKDFKEHAISNDPEYLKYLSPADFRNPKIREKIIADIGKLNDNLNLLPEKFFEGYKESIYKGKLHETIIELSLKKCQGLKKPIRAEIAKWENDYSMVSSGKSKVSNELKSLLKENPYIFSTLGHNSELTKKMKAQFVEAVANFNDLFKFMPKEWQQDPKIIVKIINWYDEVADVMRNDGSIRHQVVMNLAPIINRIQNPIEFMEKHVGKINPGTFWFIRHELSQKVRESRHLVRALFDNPDCGEIQPKYLRTLLDKGLSEELIKQLQANSEVGERDVWKVGGMMQKAMDAYYMGQLLKPKWECDIAQDRKKGLKI